MAETTKKAAKKAATKTDPFDALLKAVEAARKAGLAVKGTATDGAGKTVRL